MEYSINLRGTEYNINLREKAGYNLPLISSIKNMRKSLRGDWEGDAFVIAHYNSQGTRTELHKGYLLTEDQVVSNVDIVNSAKMLTDFLDSENQEARFAHCCTPADNYKKEAGTMALLFVKCKDGGVIGIAWLDNNGSSKKALLMCGFLGYELGLINDEKDKVLWESTTQYLIDDMKLIRSIENVELILALSFMEEVYKKDPLEVITTE